MDLSHDVLNGGKTTITQKHVDGIIAEGTILATKLGVKTTVAQLTLKNGFAITEQSSCVDPKNYSHEMGLENATARIENKVWEFECYRLHEMVCGIVGKGFRVVAPDDEGDPVERWRGTDLRSGLAEALKIIDPGMELKPGTARWQVGAQHPVAPILFEYLRHNNFVLFGIPVHIGPGDQLALTEEPTGGRQRPLAHLEVI